METKRKRKPPASLSLEQLGGQVTTRSQSKKDSEVVLPPAPKKQMITSPLERDYSIDLASSTPPLDLSKHHQSSNTSSTSADSRLPITTDHFVDALDKAKRNDSQKQLSVINEDKGENVSMGETMGEERGKERKEQRGEEGGKEQTGEEGGEKEPGVEAKKTFAFERKEKMSKIFGKNGEAKSFCLHPSTENNQNIDYKDSIQAMEGEMESIIQNEREKGKAKDLKIHLSARVNFDVLKNGEIVDRPQLYFTTKSVVVLRNAQIMEALEPIKLRLSQQVADTVERGSGFRFRSIEMLCLSTVHFVPLRGGCFIKLPTTLAAKHQILNIQTRDNRCILDVIVAHLFPFVEDPTNKACRRQKERQKANYYHFHRRYINAENLTFPLQVCDLEKLENLNKNYNIALNLYGFEKCTSRSEKYKQGYQFYPIKISKKRGSQYDTINVLAIQNEHKNTCHYAKIKDLSALVRRSNSNSHRKSHACPYCLNMFSSQSLLDAHKSACESFTPVAAHLPNDHEKILKFNDFGKGHPPEFQIFFDFETYEVASKNVCFPNETPLPASTEVKFPWIRFPSELSHVEHCNICTVSKPCIAILQSIKPLCALNCFSYAYQILSDNDQCQFPLRIYQNSEAESHFLKSLKHDMTKIHKLLKTNRPMIITDADQNTIENAQTCFVCHKSFGESKDRHRHHNHQNRRFIGMACQR